MYSAWLELADEYAARQYRDADGGLASRARLEALASVMQRDLEARLANGEFNSFGVLTSPSLGASPEQVPAFLWEKADTQWLPGILKAFGRTYEDVRLVRNPHWADGDYLSTEGEQTDAIALNTTDLKSSGKRPKGRPNRDSELDYVVIELLSAGAFAPLSRKEQEHLVSAECRKRYPRIFRKETTPSRQTVRRGLDRNGVFEAEPR